MAIADADDIATRLGRTLTDEEAALCVQVIRQTTGFIAEAAGKTVAEIEALDPMPATLEALCIDKTIAVGTNPSGAATTNLQIGSFSEARNYGRDGGGGLALTDEEGRSVRFAIYGTNSGSARARSAVDTRLDYLDDGVLDDSVPAE